MDNLPRPYPYERELYNRGFLNCYQRQSLVMLAERFPTLHHLFRKCLISTDDFVEHVVRHRRPRYDFQSEFFAPDDLLKVGVVQREEPFETYVEARQAALNAVEREGFALLVIDVFYLPHCPEYRKQHITHTITLTGYDAASREWTLIDDNPASVLFEYRYAESIVSAAYDNNVLRRLRFFSPADPGQVETSQDAEEDFFRRVEKHQDSYRLLTEVDDFLGCPWIAPAAAISMLHDALSLYHGSRACLLEYVRQAIDDADVGSAVGQLVEKAKAIQNVLLVGKVTGSVDTSWMKASCADLRDAENGLVSRLRAIG